MQRINVMVSDEAKVTLRRYKEEGGYTTLDEALDDLLKVAEQTRMVERV